MQFLQVVPSRREEDSDGEINGNYVNLSLLDELTCASTMREHAEVFRLAMQVCQSEDRDLRLLLTSICTRRYKTGIRYP